jgi:hypothetical protein
MSSQTLSHLETMINIYIYMSYFSQGNELINNMSAWGQGRIGNPRPKVKRSFAGRKIRTINDAWNVHTKYTKELPIQAERIGRAYGYHKSISTRSLAAYWSAHSH